MAELVLATVELKSHLAWYYHPTHFEYHRLCGRQDFYRFDHQRSAETSC